MNFLSQMSDNMSSHDLRIQGGYSWLNHYWMIRYGQSSNR